MKRIQGNSLFGDEISHIINDLDIKNVTFNSDALLSYNYNNKIVKISNLTISDVRGLSESSSLLQIDTKELENADISIDQLKIHSCISNGQLIKFSGNENRISIKNSIIHDNKSYGPIIENDSENVIYKHKF